MPKINSDLALHWSPPADGTFVAAIGNIVHRGGPDYLYHLQVERALPALQAIVAKTSFAIESGKTNEIKVTLNRLNGFQSKLTVVGKGLPDGVALQPADAPEKAADVALKLVAATNAVPFSGPIQFFIRSSDPPKDYPVTAELTTGGENGFTKLLIQSTDTLWLTVLPAAPK